MPPRLCALFALFLSSRAPSLTFSLLVHLFSPSLPFSRASPSLIRCLSRSSSLSSPRTYIYKSSFSLVLQSFLSLARFFIISFSSRTSFLFFLSHESLSLSRFSFFSPCQSNRIPFPFLHAFFSLAICLLDYHLFVRCYVTHFIITPAHFSHSCFRFYENVLLKTDNYVPGN